MKSQLRQTLVFIATLMAMAYFANSQPCQPNSVVNGSFENGNTGFTSGLNFTGATKGGGGGNFAINTNAQLANIGLNQVYAHGGSYFFIADGSNVNPTVAWQQTVINLVVGNSYVFSFWACNIHWNYPAAQTPSLTGEINGVTVIQTGLILTNTWTQYSYTYTAAATTAILRISQGNFALAGNDFGVDDISFAGTASISADATGSCTGACNGTASVNVLNASGPAAYLWNTSPAATTQALTGLCSGTYTVTVTDNSGCTAQDSVTISCPCSGCISVQNDCPALFPVADQECQWSTGGNSSLTVNGNKNFIGTVAGNNTPFRIFTNGAERIHVNGGSGNTSGNVGIGTTAPGNRLEINTNSATPAAGLPGFSGLRFKDLNSSHAAANGNGKVLSVNASGDVILVNDNTVVASPAYEQQVESRMTNNDAKIAMLENRIREMEIALASCCNAYEQRSAAPAALNEHALMEQNEPNPFSERTTIGYLVPQAAADAMIKIFTSGGTELKSFRVNPGKGNICFEAGELGPGIYVYSLFVDGRQVDTKWMMLTK
jgi:hypothetical protein